MTDYAWFPVTSPTAGSFQWNPTGNWTNGAFWANATTITNPPITGTVPGPSDGAYIVAANVLPIFIPPGYSLPPYDVTLTLDTTQTVATLGLAQWSILEAPHYPTLDIAGGSLDVTGTILDTFSTTFPPPIGFEFFSGGGSINLSASGKLEVGVNMSADITVNFADAGPDLVTLDGPATAPDSVTDVFGTFSGLNGANAIDLPNFSYAGTTFTYNPSTGAALLQAADGDLALLTIKNVAGNAIALAPDSGTGTEIIAAVTCFAEGTAIRTPSGDVAVERLRAGDAVTVLEDGEPATRLVRWLGQRRIDVRTHPRPDLVAPIRIAPDAIGPGIPARELSVSPDHALFLDGVLIPARMLVNGRTILRDPDVAAIRYFHIELERHAVLLAEGVAAESYLDTGNRALFEDGGAAPIAHPDLATPRPKSWDADACAPLATDPAIVEPIWRRLAARAVALGHAAPVLPGAADDPGLWLEAAGEVAPVASADGGKRIFALPDGAAWVRLRSGAFRPSDRMPWVDDRRRLGVSVARIVAHGPEGTRDIPLDGPGLADGWWGTERDGDRVARWTDGNARLLLPAATRRLEVHLAG